MPTAATPKPVPGPRAGDWLVRLVVPAYVTAGALLKALTGSPMDLPGPLLRLVTGGDQAGAAGLERLHLGVVAVELALAGGMFASAWLARPLAVLTLSAFAALLLAETAQGASTCGCFGAVRPSPMLVLVIDLALLALALALPRRPAPSKAARDLLALNAGMLAGAAAGLLLWWGGLFGMLRAGDPGLDLQPGQWRGQSWEETPLASRLSVRPADYQEQSQRWVIYARSCPSCRLYFEENPPIEGERLVAVEIPPPPVPEVAPPPGATGRPPPVRRPAHPDIACEPCVRTAFPEGSNVRALSLPIILHIDRGRVTRVEQPAH